MIKAKFFSIKVLCIPLLASLFSACSVQKSVIMGPFIKTASIETDLIKGVSTKKDVQRYLGAPQGFGGPYFHLLLNIMTFGSIKTSKLTIFNRGNLI
jgi:hypothetical protein